MNEKPGKRFAQLPPLSALTLILPLLYLISFGPARLLIQAGLIGFETYNRLYFRLSGSATAGQPQKPS